MSTDMRAPSRRLTPREAAAFGAFSESQLRKWRQKGIGPVYERIGYRSVVYPLDELHNWLAAHRQHSTSEAQKHHG